jgi:DNA-binding response OmpR family regulator
MTGATMTSSSLAGRMILVVEDEPLIALDLIEGLKAAGASVCGAHSVREGLVLAERPDLSAAVLDFKLSDGGAAAVCARLDERHVPFILHSGYTDVHDACHSAIVLPKPATSYQVVSAVEKLLRPVE